MARETWGQQCVCPGAGIVREQQARAEELRLGVADVMAEVRRTEHPSPEEIEAKISALYLRHGEPPPPGLTGWARIPAASTARRGTRRPRLLALGIRAVARTIRWAWQPGGADAGNRAETRKLYRSMGVLSLIAALLTATAVRSSGGRRLSAAVGATVLWLATVWGVTLGTVVARIAEFAEEHPTSSERDLRPRR